MRAGVCTIQLQSLTPEAASVVKQAVSLAKRRGHAQVTPLHVASAMLSTSCGLLKRACVHCHSHPLQCRALELCFNVALNRLPSSTQITPLLGTQYSTPSLSNALVAAFKRAQAHQRRGSLENQQQPILALKIEIQQLIISILDDPSVSRVMREAGFSSTLVKNKVEQAVSLPPMSIQSKEVTSKPQPLQVKSDDVRDVFNELLKRRNIVIVGECVATIESVAKSVMERFERGNVEGDLRYVQFISFPLKSMRSLSKKEAQHKLEALRFLVKSFVGKGIVLYLGDLKWLFDQFWSNYDSFMENVIMELKQLVNASGETPRVWLMGIATFQTYMKGKTCHPSLESLWELHTMTILAGSLSLSLNLDSNVRGRDKSIVVKEGSTWPSHEDQSSISFPLKKACTNNVSQFSSSLPQWLQNCKEESEAHPIKDQEYANTKDGFSSVPIFLSCKAKHLKLSYSPSPASSTSTSSNERKSKDHQDNGRNLIMFMPESDVPKPDLLSNPNSSPNSVSSNEAMEGLESSRYMFKEFNAENLKILCDALEKKVQWQKEAIHEIATTILECRSGMNKRARKEVIKGKQVGETLMLFLGPETQAKEKISKEMANIVFGSYDSFITIGLSSFSSCSSSTKETSNHKRGRDELGGSYLQRFGEAVDENPHRVFYMEDMDQLDYFSQKGIKKVIENGRVTLGDGESVPLKDAIIIFSCESIDSVSSRLCSPQTRQNSTENERKGNEDDEVEEEEKSPCLLLDLNVAIEDEINGDEISSRDISIIEIVDKQISFMLPEL